MLWDTARERRLALIFLMVNAILGTKSHMTQAFTRQGRRLSVTVVQSGPNLVTFLRTAHRDGYWALQLGFGTKRPKNIKKPVLGHLKKALKSKGTPASPKRKRGEEELKNLPRFLKETRIPQEATTLEPGDTVNPSDVLKTGDVVQVTGVSKGKGFAGVVKRWGFAGGPKTHGQSDRLRAPGSIGQRQTPGRVYKGKRMAGHMGAQTKTVKNLQVIGVDEATGQIKLSGPVPGPRGNLLIISKIGEAKKPFEMFDNEKGAKENGNQEQEN